ncbi:hypothetical protein [Silanimonas sp.]|uniref:hypothetical protein n=1 Tax=Silanimonas sp. TaxID=1929290 RepID=UPI0022BCADE3|nr:hypothetical protein [Silanimonas sp.]MCZ8166822.1 hypothetical protein [Silanimonas sp.]
MDPDDIVQINREDLTRWADSCLHVNHLGTLASRALSEGDLPRAEELVERARKRAFLLLNELFANGAQKPVGYAEPESAPNISLKRTNQSLRD